MSRLPAHASKILHFRDFSRILIAPTCSFCERLPLLPSSSARTTSPPAACCVLRLLLLLRLSTPCAMFARCAPSFHRRFFSYFSLRGFWRAKCKATTAWRRKTAFSILIYIFALRLFSGRVSCITFGCLPFCFLPSGFLAFYLFVVSWSPGGWSGATSKLCFLWLQFPWL